MDDRASGWKRSGLAIVLVLVAGSACVHAQQLGDLSGPWQLFADDHLVAEKAGVVRTYHAFERYSGNPVLRPDRPWEGSVVYVYGTVLPNESGPGYRMWYHTWSGEYRILYATSLDGLTWHKPDLGLIEYGGSTSNNILIRRTHEDHTPQVIHTPWEADPLRRYKLINYDYGRTPPDHVVSGYWGAWSDDGVHWNTAPANPVLVDPGDVGQFVWDPHAQRYLGYPKKFTDVRGYRRRCVGISTTTNFESWPESTLILIPDEFDDRWVAGNQHTDFYGLSGFAYESMYIGFLWIFRITDGGSDGPIFVELVTSRDGVNWTRQEEPRPPILDLGTEGGWDDGMVFTTNHPLVEDGVIKLWYGGFDETHGPSGSAAIGLATLRKDGFASLDAAGAGTVTTKKLTGLTGSLRINYAVHDDGWLRVELLDEHGRIVPGYRREDCVPLVGDSIDQVVAWQSGDDLPLDAQPLRLRFVLNDASLYSFGVGGDLQVIDDRAGTLYTFEGDQGTNASDKLTEDGTQAVVFANAVAVNGDPAEAAFGERSVAFTGGGQTRDALDFESTTLPGTHFTLSAMVRPTSSNLARLFSSWAGDGTPSST